MKLIITILTFVLTTANTWAGMNPLSELVEEAMQNNPEIRAAKEHWETAKSAIPLAVSLEDPVFSVMFENIPDSSVNPGAAEMRKYSISQEFPYPGKLSLMGEMAQKVAEMSYEGYRRKINQVIRELKSVYYDYFMINKAIEVNLETEEILHHLSRIAEAKYATGLVSQWDILKAQIELAQLANETILLEQEKESITARINKLVNRPLETQLGEPSPIMHQKELPSLESLAEKAGVERPELKEMARVVNMEEVKVGLAQKSYYPDFMLRMTQREAGGKAAGWEAEIGLTLPLWFSSKQDYGVKEANSRLERAKREYEAMKNMVMLDIKEARVKIRSSKSLIGLHRSTHIPLAEQALEGARIGYETGKVDFFSLMESWKTVKNYRLEYYKSLASFEQGWAELEEAVGSELP